MLSPWWEDVLGLAILLVIILTYIPQYLKIIRKKSSQGFHPIFLFLGHLGAFAAWQNALLFYLPTWETCHGWRECSEESLGFLQLFVQWLCFLTLYLLYLKYWKSRRPYISFDNDVPSNFDSNDFSRQTIWIFALSSLGVSLVLLVLTIILISLHHWQGEIFYPHQTQVWGDILSACVIIATLFQYLPQIYHTYLHRSAGSLSLITLSLWGPGTLIWTVYLAIQKASNWSTWVPYLITGLLQLTLLILGIYYDYRRKKSAKLYNNLLNGLERDLDLETGSINKGINEDIDGEIIYNPNPINYDGNSLLISDESGSDDL